MKKYLVLLVFFVMSVCMSPGPADAGASADVAATEDWIFLPAGAKPSYMGIHGGTMPVSLLVSNDGESLLTFVGETGNDFMDALRNFHLPLPSLGNGTGFGMPRTAPDTGLFAGNATATLPVFALSGDVLADMRLGRSLEPFGLSQAPLSIEGNVAPPDNFPHARSFRLSFFPDYFQPRRSRAK